MYSIFQPWLAYPLLSKGLAQGVLQCDTIDDAGTMRGSRQMAAAAVLTISSRNYSSWSLRGWLLCKMAGLPFTEQVLPIDDPANRAELLLLSASILVPRLEHDGAKVWDT